jgi:hypothetical protein
MKVLLTATATSPVGNFCAWTRETHNRRQPAVKQGLISATVFRLNLQPLKVSAILRA